MTMISYLTAGRTILGGASYPPGKCTSRSSFALSSGSVTLKIVSCATKDDQRYVNCTLLLTQQVGVWKPNLDRLADEFGVAVVITNQVVAQVDGGAMFQVSR